MRSDRITIFALLILLSLSCFGCVRNSTDNIKNFESPFAKNPIENISPPPQKLNYTIQTLDVPYRNFFSPALHDKELYLCVHTNNTADSLYEQLVSIDLDTNKEEIVFKSQHKLAAVQGAKCNAKWLIWLDCSAVSGGEPKVYAKDLDTGKTSQICKDYLVSPYLYNNYAAWIEASNNNSKVILYNLNTGKRKEIAEVNFVKSYNADVYMNDGKLLWTDNKDGKGFYNFYDLSLEKTLSIEAPSKYPGYAKFTGSKIFSMDFDNYADWSSNRLAVYDMETKSYKKISSTYLKRFDLKSDSIAAIDDKNELWLGFHANAINNMEDLGHVLNLPSKNVFDAKFTWDGKLIAYNESGPEPYISVITTLK